MVERYMEFLNCQIYNPIDEGFTIVESQCPTSTIESMAMLIHMISFRLYMPPPSAGVVSAHVAELVNRLINDTIDEYDSGLIARCRALVEQTGAGVAFWFEAPTEHYFNPPILYAKSSLFFCAKGTNTERTIKAECRIGYTLEKVTKDAFIAALVG